MPNKSYCGTKVAIPQIKPDLKGKPKRPRGILNGVDALLMSEPGTLVSIAGVILRVQEDESGKREYHFEKASPGSILAVSGVKSAKISQKQLFNETAHKFLDKNQNEILEHLLKNGLDALMSSSSSQST